MGREAELLEVSLASCTVLECIVGLMECACPSSVYRLGETLACGVL